MDAERRALSIPVGEVTLAADVAVPSPRHGTVAFAHGSGSGRHSPRNRYVADQLNAAGLATVLADLLTEQEEELDSATGHLRFDIDLLANRVTTLVDWLAARDFAAGTGIGLFGASTGAAAALLAAAQRPTTVSAVVSRGGRPDLAGPALADVRQPTLLIVGGSDTTVIDLNHQAGRLLAGPVRLELVPGATHLFPEPGALEQVARLAAAWFRDTLVAHPAAAGRPGPPPAGGQDRT